MYRISAQNPTMPTCSGNPEGEQRRIQKRQLTHVAFTLIYHETHSDGSTSHEVDATTLDISTRGLAFIHTEPIESETVVYARFHRNPDLPILKGLVRACQHIGGHRYRIGVELAEAIPSDAPDLDEKATPAGEKMALAVSRRRRRTGRD